MPSSGPKITQKPGHPRWLVPGIAAGLALLTIATFFGLHRCEFVDLDDYNYVVNNAHVNKGLSWSVFAWAFTHAHARNWHPVTWLSHALDCQLYGLHPAGHHVSNLILHTLNTVVLLLALRRLTSAVWRSAFVAALFAVHPLHVESVAWVSERKDVLSGLFFMLALYGYARYAEARVSKTVDRGRWTVDSGGHRFNASRSGWYVAALCFFALGLMSKPMLVTLPLILLLLDYWPLGRLQIRNPQRDIGRDLLLEKLPFLALAAASSVITLIAQRSSQASLTVAPMNERLGNAAVSCAAYLRQMFWPEGLSVFYPYPRVLPLADIALPLMLLVGITVLAVALRRSRPFVIVGWLWFLGMLLPVIGIIQVGAQARADRYTYLPSIGVFLAVTWTAALIFRRAHPFKAALAGTVVLCGLVFLARSYSKCWENSSSLFQHAAKAIPNNYYAIAQMAMRAITAREFESATADLRRALEIEPEYPVANHHMGLALVQQGRDAEAIPYLRRAQVQPDLRASTHFLLAVAYSRLENLKEAQANLDLAETESPGAPEIAVLRASLLARQGKGAEAERAYRALLAAHPDHEQGQIDFAGFLLSQNRPAEAEMLFVSALKRQPTNLALRTAFATALSMQGKLNEAILQLEQARRLAPSDSMVQFQSAEVLAQAQKPREALACYEKSLELNPTSPATLNNLAWMLATNPDDQIRNGRRAVELAQKACELTKWEMPMLIGTLAAAYAEAGLFEDAIKTAQRARDQAKAVNQEDVAKKNQELLELYRSGKPYHEPAQGSGRPSP